MSIPARHEVAKQLGRRVSRGEYERIFSALQPKKLPQTKAIYLTHKETGEVKRHVYHPIIAVRVAESPKAQRKKADKA